MIFSYSHYLHKTISMKILSFKSKNTSEYLFILVVWHHGMQTDNKGGCHMHAHNTLVSARIQQYSRGTWLHRHF